MQDKIFKVKIFEVTRKSVKSVKVFSLEIFRLYGTHKKDAPEDKDPPEGKELSNLSWPYSELG